MLEAKGTPENVSEGNAALRMCSVSCTGATVEMSTQSVPPSTCRSPTCCSTATRSRTASSRAPPAGPGRRPGGPSSRRLSPSATGPTLTRDRSAAKETRAHTHGEESFWSFTVDMEHPAFDMQSTSRQEEESRVSGEPEPGESLRDCRTLLL